MAEFEEFEFPDEIEAKEAAKEKETKVEIEAEGDDVSIEIEDDTPEKDRNKEPLPKDIVENLEKDELEDYSEKVKIRLKQMKKVWHDERREKERAVREQQEALALAQRVYEENRQLKSRLSAGDEALVSSFKESATRDLEMAKREYREAYEAGDSDRLVEAQEKIADAKIKADRLNNFKPTPLQEEKFDVQRQQELQTPKKDPKAASWQERNTWFGKDEEMTSLALGLHEKLVKQNGLSYATTDEYYKRIDETMRKRFPEEFEDQEEVKTAETRTKPSTVVAPATRSTSSKKVRLTQSQVAIAKKLGLTPEQYVRELLKMEAR
jgi:hypothetical protein